MNFETWTPFRGVNQQTHHMYFTLKRRGNCRFQVVSACNTRGVFVWTTLCQLAKKQMIAKNTNIWFNFLFLQCWERNIPPNS